MIPNRKKYYILSNKLPLVAHFRLNLSKVLFLPLTYFSISNLVLTLCFRPTISGNMFVLQSHRYNLAISNKKFSKGRYESIIESLRSTTRRQRQRNKFCIFNEAKQKLCTPFTCLFHFCTFLSRSRQICEVLQRT